MFCKNCGHVLSDSDKFCPNCGVRVTPGESVQGPDGAADEKPISSVALNSTADNDAEMSRAEEVKKNFHIEHINWNLDGFPKQQTGRRTDDVEFDWNKVVRERAEERGEAVSSVSERTEDIWQAPRTPIRPASEVKIEKEKKAEIPQPDEQEKSTPEPALHSIPEAETKKAEIREDLPQEQAEGSSQTEENSASPEAPVPEMPTAETVDAETAAEYRPPEEAAPKTKEAAAESAEAPAEHGAEAFRGAMPLQNEETQKIEENPAQKTSEEPIDADQEIEELIHPEGEKQSEASAEPVDKFFTYSRKNEEFQNLLDKEYKRLKEKMEESENLEEQTEEKLQNRPAPEPAFDVSELVNDNSESPEEVSKGFIPEITKAEANERTEVDDLLDDVKKNAESAELHQDPEWISKQIDAIRNQYDAGNAPAANAREDYAEPAAPRESGKTSPDPSYLGTVMPKTPQTVIAYDTAGGGKAQEEAHLSAYRPARTQNGAEQQREETAGRKAEPKVPEAPPEKKTEAPKEGVAGTEETSRSEDVDIDKILAEVATDNQLGTTKYTDSGRAAVPGQAAAIAEQKSGEGSSLSFNDVFKDEEEAQDERPRKHTGLKIAAAVLIILILIEIFVIVVRKVAPDSAIGTQILSIYNSIFGGLTGYITTDFFG